MTILNCIQNFDRGTGIKFKVVNKFASDFVEFVTLIMHPLNFSEITPMEETYSLCVPK